MKLGTLQNPKFLRFARSLGAGKAAAAGHLEALWAFTSEQASTVVAGGGGGGGGQTIYSHYGVVPYNTRHS